MTICWLCILIYFSRPFLWANYQNIHDDRFSSNLWTTWYITRVDTNQNCSCPLHVLRSTIFSLQSSLTDSTAHIQPKKLHLYGDETNIWMLVILTLNDLSAFPSINGLKWTCFGASLRNRDLLWFVNMSVCVYLIYRMDADPAARSVPFSINPPKNASLLKAGLRTHLKSFCFVYVTF